MRTLLQHHNMLVAFVLSRGDHLGNSVWSYGDYAAVPTDNDYKLMRFRDGDLVWASWLCGMEVMMKGITEEEFLNVCNRNVQMDTIGRALS